MQSSKRFEPSASVVLVLSVGVLLVPLSLLPAEANVLPESAILIHVQPLSEVGCTTEITQCSQIVRTTTEQGLLEFLLFFYPTAYEEEHYGIIDLTTSLTLPEAWEIVSWEPCGGGLGYLHYQGDRYALYLMWPECPAISEQVMPVARVVIDVSGPGRLDFENLVQNPVQLRCAEPFTAYGLGVSAEAGMDCEFTRYDCGRPEYCTPTFDQTQLHLEAHAGESAWGEILFRAGEIWCGFTAGSGAAWAEGSVFWDPALYKYHLSVTADAGELEPGTYQTQMRLIDRNDLVARCVDVQFEVLESSSVQDIEAPAIESRTWGRIKSGYR